MNSCFDCASANRRIAELEKLLECEKYWVTHYASEQNRQAAAYEKEITALHNENAALKKTNAELEGFRKLSGEYATLAQRDKIREENNQLRFEIKQHKEQVRQIQAENKLLHEERRTTCDQNLEMSGLLDKWKRHFFDLQTNLKKLYEDSQR